MLCFLVVIFTVANQNRHVHPVKSGCIGSMPPTCHWVFNQYYPSAYEKYWTDNIVMLQDSVCAESNKQLREIEQWMDLEIHESVFSRMKFTNNCTGEVTFESIEPLAGLLRNPYFCLKGEEFLVDKGYLLIPKNVSKRMEHLPNNRAPKAFLFDLGASLYTSGIGGASQQWFVDMYESKGIQFDGVYAWEASPHPPKEVWELIPGRLKPVYHWYNIPVNPVPGNTDNPLEYIKRTAVKEDYVILKIDIDNSDIEEELIQQLLVSNELLDLVDDFFFEHHVDTKPMYPYWGHGSRLNKTLKHAYQVLTTLRNVGVLAHAWV